MTHWVFARSISRCAKIKGVDNWAKSSAWTFLSRTNLRLYQHVDRMLKLTLSPPRCQYLLITWRKNTRKNQTKKKQPKTNEWHQQMWGLSSVSSLVTNPSHRSSFHASGVIGLEFLALNCTNSKFPSTRTFAWTSDPYPNHSASTLLPRFVSCLVQVVSLNQVTLPRHKSQTTKQLVCSNAYQH